MSQELNVRQHGPRDDRTRPGSLNEGRGFRKERGAQGPPGDQARPPGSPAGGRGLAPDVRCEGVLVPRP
jgi:hypothetical protein